MSEWATKRFWKKTAVEPREGGFTVTLDGREVRTPAKTRLIVPTEEMAVAIAMEWKAQEERVDPLSMPCTRSANAALDKVTPQQADVVDLIAAYGGNDLICYRAATPEGLVRRQADHWDALVDWSATELGAPLQITTGVMPINQAPETLSRFHAEVAALTAFQLTAFHDLTSISGSLVLALAVTRGRLTADEAWLMARIDEDWQIEQWGEDEEAAEQAGLKRQAFLHAHGFYRLC